jgi:pullulanase/glycogen debranching enzyme
VNVKKGPEELAGLIDFLHRKNIKVILDVVFNHTAEGNENGPVINFKGLNNEGYYRLTGKSNEFYMNGSGCGNEFRSDCLTTGQYIIECLKFWVDVYKIDGFRFDLAASIDSDTLQRIRAELPENILLIAEPWTADWERKLWTKGFLKDKGWSNWNDDYKRDIRNFLLKKDLPFDKVIDGLITSLGGTCHYGWVSTPRESVNYVECHDNDTVADLFNNNQRCLKMAGFCLLTSRGIPMIHQGQEFGKNKMGNTNSYDQNNEINWLNWELKNKNMELFNFYSGLIKLRHEIPELKELKPFDPDYISWKRFDSLKGLLINIKRENDLIILYNGNHLKNSFIEFPLPQGIWIVLCDGERIDLRGIDKAEKSYSLPYMSGAVLKRYKEI